MYSLATLLLQPFFLLHLLLWLVVLDQWRRRRESRGRRLLLTLTVLALSVLNTPVAAELALQSLESQYPPAEPPPADAQAIVVLGGTIVAVNPDETEFTLATDSQIRCLHAVQQYRQRRLPVVVCGGLVDTFAHGVSVASVMAEFLKQHGVDAADLIVEDTSRTTYENATAARPLLAERGLTRIVLVTQAYHMLRADRCFRRQGLDVVPSPCGPETDYLRVGVFHFLPDPHAPPAFAKAVHEWVGLGWYHLRGRI